MADYFRKAKSLYSSTANSFGTGEGETITPASVAGLPTDTEIVLTFDRTVVGKIERIKGTISGGNFVIASSGRGVDGTTEQAHTSPVVEYIPNAEDINDMVDGILVEHNQTGTHKSALVTTLKATGAVVTTGTSDVTIVTPKALADAGIIAPPVTLTNTVTLTNKRITKRVTTITSSATPTINTDNCDAVTITALAAAINTMSTNLSGTPTNFQTLIFRIKDDGTARAITWGTSFEAKGTALPTTTVISKVLTVGFIYDTVTSKWGCVTSRQEA